MAAVASDTVTITINDVDVQVPKGELIVESVKRVGLEIPIFCYHPRMKPVGMCRMCLVEVGFKQPDGSVRKMPKPQAACTLPASDGMVVFTDTEMVHNDRRGVLEFLLINHPLDCPICDRGGECPLQNNTLFYGPSTSRFVEIKRHLPKAFPLSQYVTLDLERCIQCGRCVRFTEEISGDSQLAFRFRGASMQPSTFELTDFESKFSGNVIEICPVGALTSSKYRFRARPWDLETKPGVCTLCSNGCNIWFDYRAGRMVRINGRTNEAVNEEWTCDRGKFGHDFYNSDKRLDRVLVRKDDRLVASDWASAYAQILEGFAPGGNQVGALAGPMVSNEALYLLQKLFRVHFSSNNVDHRFEKHLVDLSDRPAPSLIASFEHRPSVLLFGTSPADEEPILHLRIRKGWFQRGMKVVVAHHAGTDADSFAHSLLRYRPGTELTLAKALVTEAAAAGRPVAESARQEAAGVDAVQAEALCGVSADAVRETVRLLEKGSGIVTTHGIFDLEDGPAVLRLLDALGDACGASVDCFARQASHQGARDLGFLPDRLPGGRPVEGEPGLGTHEMLRAASEGRLKALWLIGLDPFAVGLDRERVTQALENVEFLVVQAIEESEAVPYASVVLPMTAPAEDDSTTTNLERRVQRFKAVLPARGDAKPGWKAVQEVMLRAKPQAPLFHARDVMAEIGQVVPAYAAANYANLDGEGVIAAG
ncbi:MAG: NADH-quinone oxidoreductase subunit NuoG [Fimbriimonadaceae bacterium]